MKKYAKLLLLTTGITLLPILAGLLLWEELPEQIATHFGADGTPNGWSGKPFAVFGLPCLLAAVHLLTVCITLADPKRKNIQHRLLMLVFWIVPAVSIVISGLIYLNALSIPVDASAAVLLLVGALYIVLGVCMPKLRQNYTVGIKLPWTLNSTENWKRTHCLGGKVFLIGGVLTILCGLAGRMISDDFALIAVVVITVLCALVPGVYSFLLFRKGI